MEEKEVQGAPVHKRRVRYSGTHPRRFEEKYKEKIFAICNNEEDLANILVSELYDTSNSKHFVWAMCGEYLVNKLLNDNDYKIKYPIEDENGDIEWNGTRYSITEERIDEDC